MNILDTASLVVTPNGYKTSKLYSIIPTSGAGDMTFSRTGDTATRVNSSGIIETVLANKPRIDYLGSTCPRLLMEEQRTNLLSYSSSFDDAYWIKSDVTISANAATSPDGTTNADKIIESATSTNHFIYKTISGSSRTFTVFAKPAGRNWIGILSDSGITFFNISTGVLGTVASGVTAKIESYANGWYRCSIKNPHSSFGATVYTCTANGVDSYLGDGSSGVYIYGAQLEAGDYHTSYIPTTTASVTRNVDECSLSSASALIGQTSGTFYFDGYVPNSDAIFCMIEKATPFSFIRLRQISGLINFTLYIDSGTYVYNVSNIDSLAVGTRVKLAFAYESGNISYYCNGALIAESTLAYSGSSFDIIRLASDFGTPSLSNNKYNTVALWKTRLTNTELNILTTV